MRERTIGSAGATQMSRKEDSILSRQFADFEPLRGDGQKGHHGGVEHLSLLGFTSTDRRALCVPAVSWSIWNFPKFSDDAFSGEFLWEDNNCFRALHGAEGVVALLSPGAWPPHADQNRQRGVGGLCEQTGVCSSALHRALAVGSSEPAQLLSRKSGRSMTKQLV